MPEGLISHNFSESLGDLVDAGERPGALLQVLVARVDVGLHGERGVVVPRPPADDGDRHAGLLTGREQCSNPADRPDR